MIYLLEDDPLRIAWFESKFTGDLIVSRTVEAAMYQFEGLRPEMVFLDHDLDMSHGHGYDETSQCAHAFVKSVLFNEVRYPGLRAAKKIVIHSINPDGARGMFLTLKQAGIESELVPFNFLKDRLVIR